MVLLCLQATPVLFTPLVMWLYHLLHGLLVGNSELVMHNLTLKFGHFQCQNHSYSELPPWSRVLLEKLIATQLVKKFPAFYGTQKFITVFIRHATWPSPEPAESNPHPLMLILILLPSKTRFPIWCLPFLFLTTILYAFLISTMYLTRCILLRRVLIMKFLTMQLHQLRYCCITLSVPMFQLHVLVSVQSNLHTHIFSFLARINSYSKSFYLPVVCS